MELRTTLAGSFARKIPLFGRTRIVARGSFEIPSTLQDRQLAQDLFKMDRRLETFGLGLEIEAEIC